MKADNNDPLSLHKYLYTEADPVDNLDPNGNQIDDVLAGIVGDSTLDAMPQLNFSTVLQNVPKVESLYVREFAPWKTFAFGFAGDNRSFTTSLDKSVTSRASGVVTYLLPTITILSQAAYSDPSHHPLLGTKTGDPRMTVTTGGGAIHLHLEAANPLVTPSADIDVKLDMSIQVKVSQACYNGHLYGDAFPDVEVFVVNQKEEATMLDEFATSGGQHTGPYVYLPRDNNRPMGDFSVCAAE